jgi:pimeloyl-ACP methyl ester carboxylesterase
MTESTGTLAVPGASLYYKLSGAGPVLLVVQGGAGGAEGAAGLARQLADAFTVVSYDRRGLARSPLDGPADAAASIEQHADDAGLLLAALTDEPAFAFGSSIGALIGLDLASRHPEQVGVLVAHEPPLPELLPDAERDAAVRAQEAVEETFSRDGLVVAMREFAATAGLDFADREPDVEIPRPDARRAADTAYFLTHDAPAVRSYRVDLDVLRRASTRIVAAAGSSSAGSWPHHCAEALADWLGRELAESPGGHSGYVMRPRAFAGWLHDVLGR